MSELAYTHDNQVRYVDKGGGTEVRDLRHGDQRTVRMVNKTGVKALGIYLGPFEYHYREGSTSYTKVMLRTDGLQAENILAGSDADSLDIFYVHADHLGSGHVLTDDSGTLLSQEEYFPYGKASDRRDTRNRYRYIGVERDEETGLCMTGPRTYDPYIARFLQGDPLADQLTRWSPWSYAKCSPLRIEDPSGRYPAGILPMMAKMWWDEHGDQVTSFYNTHVDPTRSPEQRASGAGYFDADWAGKVIVSHWLWGGGDVLALGPTSGDRMGIWAKYMKNAPGVRPAAAALARVAAERAVATGMNGIVDVPPIQMHVETENGESMIGRQYLHGTNPAVGDFVVRGTAVVDHRAAGETVVVANLTYTWNDVIDPNFIYATDTWKAKAAQALPGEPRDYTVRITWSEQSVWKFDASGKITSATGWPASLPDSAAPPPPPPPLPPSSVSP